MKELNIIYSYNYLKYDTGADDPVSKNKAPRFLQMIESDGKIPYKLFEPAKATDEDILLAHTQRYLNEVKRSAANKLELAPDTPIDKERLECAYYMAGGSIMCLNLALEGKRVVNLIGGAHHASSFQSSGFCIFNDHAIAIRKLQKEGKIKRATIYDLDVHAGQGTQEIFYEDPSVLTISIHQDPMTIYPGTGFEWQTGRGNGLGMNINLPLAPGTTEQKYMETLDVALKRASEFASDMNVLVLGVDTYKGDQLGGLYLEEDSFRKIGERFRGFDKLAVLFGGGYSTKIPDLWMTFLKGYLGN